MEPNEVPQGFELVPSDELRELRATKAEYDRVNETVMAFMEQAHEWADPLLSLNLRTTRLFNRQQHQLERQYHNVIAFRERVVIGFRALEIVVNGVLMASTHREKDARLRGLLDTVSATTEELKDLTREWFSFATWGDTLFRADTSVPQLQRRVWEQEKRLEAYQSKYGALEQAEEVTEEIGF